MKRATTLLALLALCGCVAGEDEDTTEGEPCPPSPFVWPHDELEEFRGGCWPRCSEHPNTDWCPWVESEGHYLWPYVGPQGSCYCASPPT